MLLSFYVARKKKIIAVFVSDARACFVADVAAFDVCLPVVRLWGEYCPMWQGLLVFANKSSPCHLPIAFPPLHLFARV